MLPVAGSIGICPDVKRRFPTFIACEYGPIAAGALFVDTCSIVFSPLILIYIFSA
jgi:hypothetical protein